MQVGEKVFFPLSIPNQNILPTAIAGMSPKPPSAYIAEQSDLLSVIAGRNPNQMQNYALEQSLHF